MVLEKILESPLDCKKIKSVNPKGNQSWIFIGRTDIEAEAETPVFWSPYMKNWLIGKDPNAGKEGRQEEKGMTEDEMVGWHYQLNGHEFEQAPGVGNGQGSLVCWSTWGWKESATTEMTELTNSRNDFPLTVSETSMQINRVLSIQNIPPKSHPKWIFISLKRITWN